MMRTKSLLFSSICTAVAFVIGLALGIQSERLHIRNEAVNKAKVARWVPLKDGSTRFEWINWELKPDGNVVYCWPDAGKTQIGRKEKTSGHEGLQSKLQRAINLLKELGEYSLKEKR